MGVAEHFLARGKRNIIFCEWGVATAHTHQVESRAVLDIQAIVALRELAPAVPVIADPIHAVFRRKYVAPMARSTIAGGMDGMMLDVHPNPEKAWVAPLQALDFEALKELTQQFNQLHGNLANAT